jgi:hypothetical protein
LLTHKGRSRPIRASAGFFIYFSGDSSSETKYFLLFLRLVQTPLIVLTACILVKMLLLLFGQGSRPLPPIGWRNFANSLPAYLIIEKSYAEWTSVRHQQLANQLLPLVDLLHM